MSLINRQFLLPVLLLLAIPSICQGWITFTDPEEFFAINFPNEPEVTELLYPSEWGGRLPAKLYQTQARGVDYKLTVVNYGTDESAYIQVDDHTDDDFPWLYDLRGSIVYAAHNIRKQGGEVTFDAWHHIEMVEGHQLQITHDDGARTYASIYRLTEMGRLYILEAKVPAGGLPQGLFQQSLHFLDEEGMRLRYVLNPDGSYERRTNLQQYIDPDA